MNLPKKATDNVLEQADSLLLDELVHHVAKHSAHGIEALISLADVGKAGVVQQDLLDDEYRDSLAEFGASLHDAQAERYDLGGKKEVDNLRRVVFDQCANDTKRCETEVLKRPTLGRRVEEWVEEQWDVGLVGQQIVKAREAMRRTTQKETTSFGV